MQGGEGMKKPLRVCFVSPKAYPLFNSRVKGIFGGAEVDLYLLGTQLALDDNFKISFVVGDYGQSDGEVIEGVELFSSLRFDRNWFSAPFKIWQAMKRCNADVYIIKTMSPGVLLLWLFCIVTGKKYILRTAHSTHCDGSFLKKHIFSAFFYKRAFKGASFVFTQNESDAVGIEKNFGIKAIVAANGHRIGESQRHKGDHILWVARSAAFKNPHLFLELAVSLPQYKFVMICPAAFGDKDYQSLRDTAAAIDNLEFVEGVGFFDIERYFSDARLFVNTSENEGFPNTFIQAAKAGVPIVSYKVNPDDFLNVYDCGRCARGDYVRLTVLVDQIAGNEQLNSTLGQNALKYVREHHNVEHIAGVYKNILGKIVNNGD